MLWSVVGEARDEGVYDDKADQETNEEQDNLDQPIAWGG